MKCLLQRDGLISSCDSLEFGGRSRTPKASWLSMSTSSGFKSSRATAGFFKNFLLQPTNCTCLPFAVYKRHEDTNDAQKTICPILFVSGLACRRPSEPLLGIQPRKVPPPQGWNRDPGDFVDLLLERPLVAKRRPSCVRNSTEAGARSSCNVQPRVNHLCPRKAGPHASPAC